MVLFTGTRPDGATGGMVSVVATVQVKRTEVLMVAVSANSKKVFIVRKERQAGGKLAPQVDAD